jgi:hypothetical protein
MRAGRGGGLGAIARAAALGLSLFVLTACGRGDMPSNITSLAVLPADVAPYHQMTERAVGDYLTQALARTRFRLVGAESARRLLSGPRAQDLYRRFKDQAKTSPEVSLLVAQAVADTVNAQGLLFPQLAVSVVGPVEGRVALTLSVIDRTTGQRIWRNRRERSFVGQLGDPGFLQAVKAMADELVATLPQPAEEEENP